MARVVVTGGAGFIGSHLAIRLMDDGHEVSIYDNMSCGMSPILEPRKDGFRIFRADILDKKRLLEAFAEADFVFHNAALRSIQLSIKEPLRTSEANIIGTLNVLEAAKRCRVKRVILASSSSVYGDNKVPFREDMAVDPASFYATAKAANERHALLYHRLYGLETVCLRYFTVFGPTQDGTGEFSLAIPRFIHTMLHGKRPVVFGDGSASRDFTFVGNAVDANVLAMEAGDEALGRAFNIAQGETTSVKEVIALINRFLGSSIEPLYEDGRKGEAQRTLADISLAKRVLGYSPKVPFMEGLGKTIEWEKGRL